ncbi:hypothetical protein EDD93_1734 [Streptomyces sp. 840.1]|nr:hypothetical protein EDD93_1734 [Streptomyces sp. 840.1]
MSLRRSAESPGRRGIHRGGRGSPGEEHATRQAQAFGGLGRQEVTVFVFVQWDATPPFVRQAQMTY